MPSDLLRNLVRQAGVPQLLEILSEKLSGSQLNSLLMEVFRRKAEAYSPPTLLRNYLQNKFVAPAASYDWLPFMEWELERLQAAQEHGFEPLELSPVGPLGACSAMAKVDQNKVLTALRGTEVVADATNMLALEAAARRQSVEARNGTLKLCTVHRHLRTQVPDIPGFTPHFRIFCMVSAGRDSGSYTFEKQSFIDHFSFYWELLTTQLGFKGGQIQLQWFLPSGPQHDPKMLETLQALAATHWPQVQQSTTDSLSGDYYIHVQCKIKVLVQDTWFEIADSGAVNWTQQLLQDRKERAWISGLGTQLLYNLVLRSDQV